MSWPNPWAQGGPPGGQNMMMGMGNNYTQGQWAAMQQQTWQQQWAQWEQYSQWPGQYNNDNFQQQGHVQGMAIAPPLPVGVAPPAPPPPENPPPPPPHESKQVQYNENTSNRNNSNHTISKNSQLYPISSNNQNYYQNENNTENSYYDNDNSNFSQTSTDSQQYQSPASIEEEMKKIEEEQKLFDIKISDWERDIEKWRAENANHPDKDTYRMYEDKFQTWIADALKRRQEMHQKWLQLSGKLSNTSNSTTSNYSKPSKGNISNNITIKQKNIQNSNSNKHNINNKSERSVNLKEVIPNSIIPSKSNVNDFKKSFVEMTQPPPNTNFLPPHDSKKGIPGLDLVDKVAKPLPIEIIEDDSQMDISPNNPDDFKEISKGIQNILGDEKIMNILSLVSNQISKGDNQSVQNNKQPQSFNGPNWDSQQNSVSYERQPQNLNKQHDNRQQQNFNRPPQIFDKQHGDNRQQQNFNRPPQNFDRQLQNNDRREAQSYNNQQIKNNNQPQNLNNQQDFNNQQQPVNIQQKRFNNQGENYNRQSPNINRQSMQRGFNDTQPNDNLRPNQQYPQPNRNFRDDSQDQMRSAAEPIRPPNDQRRPVDVMREGSMMSGANQMQSSGEYINRPVELKPVAPIIDQPVIDVALIVDYEHKPLRLKARNFIEPVQTFDYNHKSKDDEYKITFDEASEFPSLNKDDNSGFTRRERVEDRFTRNANRSNFVEDRRRIVGRYDDRRIDDRYDDRRRPDDRFEERWRSEDRFEERRRPEDRYEERRRPDDRYDDMRRLDNRRRPDDRYDDRRRPDDRYDKRTDDRHSDKRRVEERPSEEGKRREDRGESQSHKSDNSDSSRESRKRPSDLKESEEDLSKRPKANAGNRVIMIDDILESPGRDMRPDKIFVIIRGIPGSGKSYLAKLIRDRELEYNGSVKLLSIDDYFMQEVTTEEKDPLTGKMVQKVNMVYEYDLNCEETYLKSLYRSAKKIISDGFYSFIILDADNESYNKFGDIANFAKQCGFQVYVCNTELDVDTCFKRNIHNRSYDEVCVVKARFIEYNKGCRYLVLDPTSLLQSAAITEVDMEDVTEDDYVEEQAEDEVSSTFTSKWEKMDDVAQLARLDGISKPPRASLSMEDYLQVEDWQPKNTKPGKKSVRWADIEERREQEKMRAIGFVVGQTDWQRMTDPTLGSSALTKTKYIERVRRN